MWAEIYVQYISVGVHSAVWAHRTLIDQPFSTFLAATSRVPPRYHYNMILAADTSIHPLLSIPVHITAAVNNHLSR